MATTFSVDLSPCSSKTISCDEDPNAFVYQLKCPYIASYSGSVVCIASEQVVLDGHHLWLGFEALFVTNHRLMTEISTFSCIGYGYLYINLFSRTVVCIAS